MTYCALCTDGCKFCQPDIPADYAKNFPPQHRTHWQLKSVQSGKHPSGNEPYKLKSSVPKCRLCKFYFQHPTVPKSFGLCGKAIDDEHRKIAGGYDACIEFIKGDY